MAGDLRVCRRQRFAENPQYVIAPFIKNVAMLNLEQLSSCENGRTASGINVGFSGSAYLAL